MNPKTAPLSKNQESITIANQLNPDCTPYIAHIAFSIEGDLKIPLLKEALEAMTKRHETLRTTFQDQTQHIHASCPTIVYYEECEGELQAILEKWSHPSFYLDRLPLLRVLVIRVNPQQFLALFQIHQIIFDNGSAKVFFRELTSNYSGKSVAKEEPAYQYADYAAEQIAFLKSPAFESQLAYWKKKLSDAPELLELPWDRPRPVTISNRGDLYTFKLEKGLSQKLEHLAKALNLTFFELLYSSFEVFIFRLSGKTDIVIGTPFSDRNQKTRDLIGYFVQMAMTRRDFSDNPTFCDLAQRTQQDLAESKKNAEVPFELVVSTLNPGRSASYNPLFQVSFSVEEKNDCLLQLPGLSITPISLPSRTSHFDLSMTIIGSDEGAIEYSTDLFDLATIKRMALNFQTLLEGISAAPETRVAFLPFINPFEKHQILNEWNETKLDYPGTSSIPALFEKIAKQYASKIALTSEEGDMSYSELNAKANQFAHYLQTLGIKKGDFVGISIKRSLDLIVTVLGILKAGGACVPIDASYPPERKLYMIEDTQVKFLFTQKSEMTHFPEDKIRILCVDTLDVAKQPKENLELDIGPLDLANVLYTSGSSGKPKGVPLPHRGAIRLVCNNDRVPFTSEDKVLQTSNVSFDAMLFEVWGALLNGGTLCIYPQKDFLPDDLGDFLSSKQVTVALLTAAAMNVMVEQQLHNLKTLRCIYSAGEAMSATHAKIAFEHLPGCLIGNGYGPTENSVLTTTYFVTDPDEIQRSVPIGRPIANTLVYILDSYLQPVPIGVHGELCTGGDGIAAEYLHRPDLTREKFIKNPFGPGILYRTGDLVRYRADGNIDYLGRIDNQVKIRGFRIEIGEIEEVLRQLDSVADCLVMAREDTPGNKRLVAYIEPTKNSTLSPREVREFSVSKLPCHMIPGFFLILEKFPLTPNGKIDRKALPSPGSAAQGKVEIELPKTPLEQLIADTWSVLLNVSPIGRQDNFFFIGGHSIAGARLASVLGKTLNIAVPVGIIFEDSTLEKYTKRIEQLMQPESTQKKLVTTSELFWIWRNKEARLDPTIGVEAGKSPSEDQYKNPKKIFLTGATGFVGAFMLKELLTETSAHLYPLLRADNEKEAMERLASTLGSFGLWDQKLASRITPVCGDLDKPLLGLTENRFETLSRELDSLFHVGALVNHALPYHKLKAANITGTQEALRLACEGRIKPFHFVSTVAVFEMIGSKKTLENDDLNLAKNLFNGYAQSKWIAEKLVLLARSRGLPANIYRLSRVSGHSKTGACQTGDFLWRMAEASLFLKLAPDIGYRENITPVDFICRAIRAVSANPENINRQYHVLNPELYAYRDVFKIFQELGYPLEFVPYDQWRRSLVKTSMESEGERLQAIVPLFSEIDLSHSDDAVAFDSTNLQKALSPMGILCPPCNEKLIKTYTDYFVSIGFFPRPEKR